MVKFCFFVPETHLEEVKARVFATGAGKIGHYDCCCWQVKGEGQFRALKGSQPYQGVQGIVEKVAEYKVELVCEKAQIDRAVRAMKAAHPYETPAYEVFELMKL